MRKLILLLMLGSVILACTQDGKNSNPKAIKFQNKIYGQWKFDFVTVNIMTSPLINQKIDLPNINHKKFPKYFIFNDSIILYGNKFFGILRDDNIDSNCNGNMNLVNNIYSLKIIDKRRLKLVQSIYSEKNYQCLNISYYLSRSINTKIKNENDLGL
jgi:hypothetical protein